jgi:hypothetical protein
MPVMTVAEIVQEGAIDLARLLPPIYPRHLGGFSMTRTAGFGLFAIIAALLAYVASLSFLSS